MLILKKGASEWGIYLSKSGKMEELVLPVVRTIHLQLHLLIEAISTDAKPELSPGDLGTKAGGVLAGATQF